MTIFEQVKEKLNIVDVAEFYNLSVNRHKKAVCPFHSDNTPSLSFKDEYFKCFSCGAFGDVVSLVQKLTGCSNAFETIKRLDSDFHLGLAFNSVQTIKSISEHKRSKSLRCAFELWEKNTFVKLANAHRLLLDYKQNFAPKFPDDELDERFLLSLQMLDYVAYLCDILRIGTLEDKIKLYKDWGNLHAKI